MTLHSSPPRLVLLLLLIAGVGGLLIGCDSNGGMSGPENRSPSASISLDSRSGLTAALSAAGSVDEDGEIMSYEWTFGDESSGSGETVVHEYDSPGTYTAQLIVEDRQGAADTTQMDVMVSNVPTSFEVTIEGTDTPPEGLIKSGVFNTPDGSSGPGPLTPGDSYTFSFTAGSNVVPGSGMKLSLLTMFGQSNDAFYAFQPGGIDLFQDDAPNDRQDPTPIGFNSPTEVTDQLALWDSGTEVDQEPGFGDNQAPRQSNPDQGPAENGVINRMTDIDGDGAVEDDANGNGQLDTDSNNEYEFPAVSDAIEVMVSSQVRQSTGGSDSGVYEFTVTIENVSDETSTVLTSQSASQPQPISISPGVFAAHIDQNPVAQEDVIFFPPDGTAEDQGINGLEEIAEDANPGPRAEAAAPLTGVLVPFSEGSYAVHSDEVSFHNVGGSASEGIKIIAEDGKAGTHDEALDDIDGVKENGTIGSGPTPPGMSISETVEAVPGDRFSFASMFIQSNDFYFAFRPEGIPLFTNDAPINGSVTRQVALYDAGTEPEEEPGVGRTQAPRQPQAGDFGPDENENISPPLEDPDNDGLLEKEGFEYERPIDVIEVTITPQN